MAEDGGGGNGAEVSPKSSQVICEETPHSERHTRSTQSLSSDDEESPREVEPCRPQMRRKSHELCIITCKGTLGDPAFNKSFRRILSGLNKILNTGEERVRVRKLEPWNSVRVTFTIPGDAAQRLRALALGGDSALSRLGILSVQLDPDHVIRVGAGAIQQPQPPINPDSLPLPPSSTLPGLGGTSMSSLPGSSLSSLVSSSISPLPGPSSILGGPSIPGPSTGHLSLPGPSGIVAGPSTSGLTNPLLAGTSLPGPSTAPVLASSSAALLSGSSSLLSGSSSSPSTSSHLPGPSSAPTLPPPIAGPSSCISPSVPVAQPRPPPPKVFPFHSMNQAATVMRATEQPPQPNTRQVVSGYPPPPYPNKVEGQVVSPLLVNLLQDTPSTASSSSSGINNQSASLPPPPPPPPSHQVRIKQEESSAFVSVGAGSNSYGGGAFRRLPPPYPGRIKEEVQPAPREPILPPPPPVQPEEKKLPENNQHQESSSTSKRQYLINPLTGVLEPMSSEDEEEEKMEPIMDDDISLDKECSDIISAQPNHTPSSAAPQSSILPVPSIVSTLPTEQPTLPPVSVESLPPQQLPQPKEEKIKLRFQMDKEAVVSVGPVVSSDNPSSNPQPLQEAHSSGYKVEMYMKRSNHEMSHSSSNSSVTSNQIPSNLPQMNSSLNNNGVEVPRVPPLHISLRGRNAAVVKKDKKRDTKKARKVSGELKRTKSNKLVMGQPMIPVSPERSPERPEPTRSPSPVSPRNDPEMSSDIVPVRNYPSEAEVASILRSVVPHSNHKLLDESRLKRRESKKKMYPRLEYTGSKKGTKKGGGSLLKSVVKTNSKEVRMMSAVNKAIHRRDSADSTVTNSAVFGNTALKQRSNSVPGNGGNTPEEFRPKVNCVFGKTSVTPAVTDTNEPSKVVVNMCVNTGGSPTSIETPTATAPNQKNQSDPAKRNNEGDDSGIESMDALSEKSPNQGESPQRTTGGSVSCKSVSVTCGESPKPDQSQTNQLSTKDDQLSASDLVSGGGESPVPVRLTPALYTYSNPEKLERRGGGGESLSPSSVSGDEEDHLSHTKSHPSPEVDEDFSGNSSGRRSSSNKSLLEQLLIDMPTDSSSLATNQTSSLNSSETSSDLSSGGGTGSNCSSNTNTRRSRPSRHKTWDSQTWQTNHIDSRQSTLRVSKRKCSESASEGKQEDLGSPTSHDKTKTSLTKSSSVPADELLEEDGNSGASSDLASNRSSVSPAPPLQSPRLRHTKAEHPESPQQDKNGNGAGSGGNIRREVSVVLTKISRRTSVRQQKTAGTGVSSAVSQKDPASPPNAGGGVSKETLSVTSPSPAAHRRKTRSQASDSNNEEGGSTAKRRRMSKDMK